MKQKFLNSPLIVKIIVLKVKNHKVVCYNLTHSNTCCCVPLAGMPFLSIKSTLSHITPQALPIPYWFNNLYTMEY